MTPVTPKSPRFTRKEGNEIYAVPNNEKNRRITVKEQEELDHLLKEMIEELESNPMQRGNFYGTIRQPFNLMATPSPPVSGVKSHQLTSPSSHVPVAGVTGNVPVTMQPTPPPSHSKTTARSISTHNYPLYNSINNNNNNDANFQRNVYKTRSFSHSPAPKAKPVILYTANPYMPLASPKSSRSTPVSIEEVYASGAHRPAALTHMAKSNGITPRSSQQQQQHEYPRSYNNMSTIATTTTSGPPTPVRNHQPLHHASESQQRAPDPHHQHHFFSSPSSPTTMDRGSRGVSRSITLTPTPQSPSVIRGNNSSSNMMQQAMPSQKAAPLVASPVSQDQHPNQMYTPSSLTGVNFRGTTRIIPGAKIGDQENQNRTGVYASAYGKEKPLSRDERQELDDLINVMMEEIKHFPDYSSVRRSATTSFHPHPTQRSHSYTSGGNSSRSNAATGGQPVIESVSYQPGSGGAGVAATRAAFERAAMNNTSPDPPVSTAFDHSNNNTIKRSPRTESKSPVRHMFPIQQQQQSHPPTPKSLTRFTDHPQTSFQSAYSNRSHFVHPSPLTHERSRSSPPLITPIDSHHGGGVLSQAVEPLPPHLLTRPTHYNPRPDSRPFTYGVTSASPLIQRRRVHSESTAYVCENRPPATNQHAGAYTSGHSSRPNHDLHETYAAPSSSGMNHHSQNLYDVPADLYSTSQRLNQEIDTISEASYSSSLYDDPSLPWLERQQLKLRAKKDSSDSLMMDQRNKSARMMTELMNKVPAVQSGSEPASPAASPKLLMPSFNRSSPLPISRSPTFIKSPAKELVLRRNDEFEDASSNVTTPTAATGSKSPFNDHQIRNHPLSKSVSLIPKPITSASKPATHYASGATRPSPASSSCLQRQKSDISYDRQRNSRVSDDAAIDHHAENHGASRSKTGKQKDVSSPAAAYATINLQDKHKSTSPHHHANRQTAKNTS